MVSKYAFIKFYINEIELYKYKIHFFEAFTIY
jgi:hypothetical protein